MVLMRKTASNRIPYSHFLQNESNLHLISYLFFIRPQVAQHCILNPTRGGMLSLNIKRTNSAFRRFFM